MEPELTHLWLIIKEKPELFSICEQFFSFFRKQSVIIKSHCSVLIMEVIPESGYKGLISLYSYNIWQAAMD